MESVTARRLPPLEKRRRSVCVVKLTKRSIAEIGKTLVFNESSEG